MRSFAWLFFVLNTVLWGLYFSVTRDVVRRVDPFVFSFLELAATAPVALVLLARYGRYLTRPLLRQALGLGLLFASNTVLVALALRTTTATHAAFFPAAGGILAAGLAALLGQVVQWRTWAAGGLALAGAALLLISGRAAGHGGGDALAGAGSLAYLLYVFLSDRLSRTAGPARWAVLGVELLTTTAVLGALAASLGDWSGLPTLRPTDAALIVGVGWGASLVPAAIGLRFQQYVSPVTVEFIYALEPVMGALAGRWLLGEVLTPLGWISGALLLSGAVLHAWPAAAHPRLSHHRAAGASTYGRRWWLMVLAVALGVPVAEANAQAPAPTQVAVRLDYDSFFGFYPTLSLIRTLDSLRLLTVYGSYYTQPGYASLEVGTSLTVVRPARGLTFTGGGGLLSGSFFYAGRGFIVGEGFSAVLAAEKAWSRVVLGATLGYYGLLRRKAAAVYDIGYFHIEAGWKLHDRLTVGVLHEQLLSVRYPRNEADFSASDVRRVGVFGRGRLPGGVQAELAGGWLADGFIRASLSRALPLGGRAPRVLP